MRRIFTKKKHDAGIIAGAFDVIHPGYIRMFREAKEVCEYLIVALHDNPEGKGKLRPVLSLIERIEILRSIKFVDQIVPYTEEDQLGFILQENRSAIRILGDDYRYKAYTGIELGMDVHFVPRDHGWSTTKFKELIYESVKKQKEKK